MISQATLLLKQHFYCLSALLLATATPAAIANDNTLDATLIPLEELLQIKYIPASHIANQVSNAASAVSVVTAQDIKDYGYKTLEEILVSMRGLHFTRDYSYSFLGGRGLSSPGEYAGRILLFLDGYLMNDSFYGQAYFANDGLLDVSLIERVEFIPGGGSAGYGNGALLGAINIITKNAQDLQGAHLAYGYGSFSSQEKRFTLGETFDNGANILLSGSVLYANQDNYHYDTIEQDGSKEKTTRLFLKTDYDGISFTAAWARRGLYTPSYTTHGMIGAPGFISDETAFMRLKHDTDLSQTLKLSSSLWYGHYQYRVIDEMDPAFYIWHDKTTARWRGADIKLVGTWFENHTLSFGAEYRHDYRWVRKDFYRDAWWNESSTETFTPRKTYSGYIYDDFELTPFLKLNYGFRYEKSNIPMHAFSPHASLSWNVFKESILKLSAGKTQRQTNGSDLIYKTPEQVKTLELVLEQGLGEDAKLLGSLYQYTISHIYGYNMSDIQSKGFELEFEKQWENSMRLRMSYALQESKDASSSTTRPNSPTHLAKLNLSLPLVKNRLRLGLETHYTSKRRLVDTSEQTYAPAYWLTNLTLTAHRFVPNLTTRLKVNNVFDKRYENILSYPYFDNLPTLRDQGRTFWLEMEYTFK